MRPERLYLLDILEACEAVQRFVRRTDEKGFMADEVIQAAVLQKLIVIGEAAARLPESFTKPHPEIEWQDIVAFRNIAVHEYFAVDWQVVWVTATEDVPLLREKVNTLLSQLQESPRGED